MAPIGINKLRIKKKSSEWCTVPPGLGESEVRFFFSARADVYTYIRIYFPRSYYYSTSYYYHCYDL